MKAIDLENPTGAIFSEDGKYRYALWRLWNPSRRPLMFIGLNPSTANGISNDPTITRLMVRANREGFGCLLAGNLYAIVSPDPSVLTSRKRSIHPVGIENDDYIRQMVGMAGRVLFGWGSFPSAGKRAVKVSDLVPSPWCLGVNADGNPKHPLYISYDVPMRRYGEGEE